MRIINGSILLRSSIIKDASLHIEGGKIISCGKKPPSHHDSVIDAKCCYVSPGFIDTHIHGYPQKVLSYQIKHGTTSVIIAVSCSSPKSVKRSMGIIRQYKKCGEFGDCVLGARLEGPFISKAKAGAQNKRFIVPPSEATLRRIIRESGGLLRMMTIAPELDGAERLVNLLKKNDIIASMGHTDADYGEAALGIKYGITHATHLPNGMRKGNNNDNAVGACLHDKHVMVEMIFDMAHVSAGLLRKFLKMKSKSGVILVTDSVRAEMKNSKTGGNIYRLKDGTIAGSDLTMMDAIKNAVRFCKVDIKDAVAFATINPAKLFGVDAHKGAISAGKDADLVIFDKHFDVKVTIVRGRIVYRKRGF